MTTIVGNVNYFTGGSRRPQYDVTPDGSRFLMLQIYPTVRDTIIVVESWFEEVKRLVPVK